jgi:hypothetical protein
VSIFLSASSISDFIRCPQKVLYRRTKPFPEIPNKDMVMGKVAHAALEKGWSDKNRAYQVIDHWIRSEGLSNKDRTDLQFCIDMYFLNFRRLVSEDDQIEYNFKLSLHEDIYLVGKMDRISNGNIIDWKTGKVPNRLHNDVQCIIYDYAYQKIFGKDTKSICLASLSTGDLVPYIKNQFYIDELFDNIIPRMIKTIKNESYERLGMFNHSCFRCPYKTGCLIGTRGEEEYVVDNRVSPE